MASKRQYATIAEVEQFADVTSTDDTEFEDRISQAEELIDAWVGFQNKAVCENYQGEVSSVNSKTIVDSGSGTPLVAKDDFFKGCTLEIIGGGGAGASRTIESSSYDNRSITYTGDAISGLDTTSVFRIFQLGKFPRYKDMSQNRAGDQYYKYIPEAVKRAVAAQVEYIINQGDDFFSTDDTDKDSESIGNYSYSGGSAAQKSALVRMIAPKARTLLKGITNRTGRIEV